MSILIYTLHILTHYNLSQGVFGIVTILILTSTPFLSFLKTSMFPEVEKGRIGNEWVNENHPSHPMAS